MKWSEPHLYWGHDPMRISLELLNYVTDGVLEDAQRVPLARLSRGPVVAISLQGQRHDRPPQKKTWVRAWLPCLSTCCCCVHEEAREIVFRVCSLLFSSRTWGEIEKVWMNIVPEVIVIIMSVVVLSLVRLRSFPSFVSFRGEALSDCRHRECERNSWEEVKKKWEERESRRKEGRIWADGWKS